MAVYGGRTQQEAASCLAEVKATDRSPTRQYRCCSTSVRAPPSRQLAESWSSQDEPQPETRRAHYRLAATHTVRPETYVALCSTGRPVAALTAMTNASTTLAASRPRSANHCNPRTRSATSAAGHSRSVSDPSNGENESSARWQLVPTGSTTTVAPSKSKRLFSSMHSPSFNLRRGQPSFRLYTFDVGRRLVERLSGSTLIRRSPLLSPLLHEPLHRQLFEVCRSASRLKTRSDSQAP